MPNVAFCLMVFPSSETSSRRVEHGTPHHHALRNAEPIRVCMVGMLIFAVTRGDDVLVDTIEGIMEGSLDQTGLSTPMNVALADQLRAEVAEEELVWWLQTERLARRCAKARAIYSHLASLRLRSASSTTFRRS